MPVRTPSATQPRILLDADVLSHFLKGERAGLLNAVFPGRLVILREVMAELEQVTRFDQPLERLVKLSSIAIIDFSSDNQVLLEFENLLARRGPGESACMAMARYHGDYIASSNLRDIVDYCTTHRIKYYTTLDILHFAIQDGHLTPTECDAFLALLKKRNSKPGFTTYQQYLNAGPRSR
ncbi:type II toxin-antitoxin system VapC family toxin [Hymenobacter ruricola]|uniref:PIN domain-containing protein n=1 Tax=Hymenobacter ruricola TaxID=2791023 RepID=A0ABS0I6F8_9BACT|nr:hypothetical protein [Hymenobacter ruricola]MBF9222487.1 hypothetical protein [Hymenobacter ruricola]